MSLIYSVLKPKRASMTRNDWMMQVLKIQTEFSGFEENHHQKAVVY